MIDLIHLAAEAENDRRRHVGMIQNAAQCALELLRVGTNGMPAAFAVWKRRYAVYIGRQCVVLKTSSDQLRGMRRAVAGRNHCNVVARPHAAILPRIAEKCGNVLDGGRN